MSRGGYIQLTADALGVGSGMYMPSPELLARYRQAVDNDRAATKLQQIIAALEKKGISVSSHEVLKTAPRGYPKDHPRIDLLRNKDLVCWQEWPVGPWLATTKPKQRIVQFFRATAPLNDWLATQVGSSAARTLSGAGLGRSGQCRAPIRPDADGRACGPPSRRYAGAAGWRARYPAGSGAACGATCWAPARG